MVNQKEQKKSNYWIMKSEPNEFGIDDLERMDISIWDGIRNYQVRNMIRDDMKVGDRAFFYHSNAKEIGIVGEMEIAKTAYPDPTQFKPTSKYYDAGSKKDNPRWLSFDVKFVNKFPRILTLAKIKIDPDFAGLPLVKMGNRLSVMPINKYHYNRLRDILAQ